MLATSARPASHTPAVVCFLPLAPLLLRCSMSSRICLKHGLICFAPAQVILTKLEEKELKSLRPKGLTLLGFKPVSCLKDSHQLGPSRFVYPDERWWKGSTAAFSALHRACCACEHLEPEICVRQRRSQ